MISYVDAVKESLSQVANALLGGYPDEMLSSRAHREGLWIEKPLDFVFGSGHCKDMLEHERESRGQHPANRPSDPAFMTHRDPSVE